MDTMRITGAFFSTPAIIIPSASSGQLNNYFNLYDPDVIVLGGGVTKARTFFHREMVRVLKERCLQLRPP